MQAQIEIGDNIPVVTGRVQSAGAIDDPESSTALNVERQDVGVVLRTYKLRESDRIVVIHTAENGKVRSTTPTSR